MFCGGSELPITSGIQVEDVWEEGTAWDKGPFSKDTLYSAVLQIRDEVEKAGQNSLHSPKTYLMIKHNMTIN